MYLADFEEADGDRPVSEFRRKLSGKEERRVDAKLAVLEQEGLAILELQPLLKWIKPITGTNHEVYEARPGPIRIVFYVDRDRHCFVLLHAFRKQQKSQPEDIEEGLRNLAEYLERRH